MSSYKRYTPLFPHISGCLLHCAPKSRAKGTNPKGLVPPVWFYIKKHIWIRPDDHCVLCWFKKWKWDVHWVLFLFYSCYYCSLATASVVQLLKFPCHLLFTLMSYVCCILNGWHGLHLTTIFCEEAYILLEGDVSEVFSGLMKFAGKRLFHNPHLQALSEFQPSTTKPDIQHPRTIKTVWFTPLSSF
jgi:hypothetical protein